LADKGLGELLAAARSRSRNQIGKPLAAAASEQFRRKERREK
jgi:hypothetical protein